MSPESFLVFMIFLILLTSVAYVEFFNELNVNNIRRFFLDTQTRTSSEELMSLSYVSWTEVSEDDVNTSGVVYHDPARSYDGVNLYCSRWSSVVYFMNNEGEVLHTIDLGDSGEYGCLLLKHFRGRDFLMLGQNNSRGDSLWNGRIFLRVNWDSSRQVLLDDMMVHHDFDVAENGDIYVLSAEEDNVTRISDEGLVRNEHVLIIDSSGFVKEKINLASMILDEGILDPVKTTQYPKYKKKIIDPLHTNTLKILDRKVNYGNGVSFRRGQVLFCMRHLDLIGVIDVGEGEVVWWWGPGELDRPHHPTLLPNGNILIFDNGFRRKWSRVIELNPVTEEIVWEYTGNPRESFYTRGRGSAQRLPNGNTLITESNKGHVFEITRDGEVVWDYWNPLMNEAGDKRGVIYRMMRLTWEEWEDIRS